MAFFFLLFFAGLYIALRVGNYGLKHRSKYNDEIGRAYGNGIVGGAVLSFGALLAYLVTILNAPLAAVYILVVLPVGIPGIFAVGLALIWALTILGNALVSKSPASKSLKHRQVVAGFVLIAYITVAVVAGLYGTGVLKTDVMKAETSVDSVELRLLAEKAIENDKPKLAVSILKNSNIKQAIVNRIAEHHWINVNRGRQVEYQLAKSKLLTPQIVGTFRLDRNGADRLLRWSLSDNPRTPREVLEKLSRDEDRMVRQNVAGNPSTPTKVLVKLVKDKHHWVRMHVAKNSNCPKRLLNILLKDPNEEVRLAAMEGINSVTK